MEARVSDGDLHVAQRLRGQWAVLAHLLERVHQRGARLCQVGNGGRLVDERVALITRNHGELYRLGAHPYVLWHFVEAIRVWTGETTWPEMKERFRDDIRPHGSPDFAT